MIGVVTPEYEYKIIERYAESLYRKAAHLPKVSAIAGGALGLLFGALPFSSLVVTHIPRSFGFATMLLGLIVGGLIGYVVGDGRSFSYLLQAQQALCQVQTERNTAYAARAAAVAVAPRQAAAAAPRPAAPAPAAPPIAAPAPVPAAAPVPATLRAPTPAPAAAAAPAVGMPPLSPPVSQG
jgi:hypothetical protein